MRLFEIVEVFHLPQFHVSRAEVPADTEQNDVSLEVTPFEGILALTAHDGDLFRSFLPTLVLCQLYFATVVCDEK
jgi:hypothetical protein